MRTELVMTRPERRAMEGSWGAACMGRYLRLAIAVEKGRAENVGRLAGQLLIPLADIESASAEALAWAEDAVRLSQ